MRVRTPAASLALALALALTSLPALAGKPITVGKTYPIAEPDTLDEIKGRAGTVDWRSWMRRAPADYGAFVSATLPRATETRSRLFDPTYYLPEDIRDAQGKVIAPKGLPVNVYTRLKVSFRYIVIGDTPEDRQWLREVARPAGNDKILLAGGNVFEVRQRTGLRVHLLDARFIERFGLQAVPAIVQQAGTQLRVDEYRVLPAADFRTRKSGAGSEGEGTRKREESTP